MTNPLDAVATSCKIGGAINEGKGPDMTIIEALANAAIGLIVSWAATFFVLGYTAAGSVAVTAMFFGLSFARSWALRVLFRRLGNG